MPYIGKQLVRGQNRKLDDISSGFNGSQTTFTLQVASQNVTVGSALQLWISLGGVIQDPLSDYTIAGNQITFTTAPAASLDFFGVIQGDVTDTNTPGDATVTTSKLATGLTVNLADGSAATSSLQLGGTDSGLFSSAADKVNVTTGGVERLEIGDSEVVFNDPSNDVDFRVESNGNANMLFVDAGNDRVGIGTASPHSTLTVAGSGVAASIISSNDNKLGFRDGVTDRGFIGASATACFVASAANGTERLRIDSSGRLLVGTSSSQGSGRKLQVADTSAEAGIEVFRYVTSATSAPVLNVSKSKSSTLNTNTAVVDDDYLGYIQFKGANGSGYNVAAQITGEVDGTPGVDDMPGRIVFSTTADGASSPTERLRIDSSGRVGIGDSNPDVAFSIKGSGGPVCRIQATDQTNARLRIQAGNTSESFLEFGDSDDTDVGEIVYGHSTNHMRFRTNGSEQMRIDNSGRFLLGTSSSRGGNFNNGSGVDARFQIEGTSFTQAFANIVRNSNDANSAGFALSKSRGTSVGSYTIVDNGDKLGEIAFQGSDGAKLVGAADIEGQVDGTPGTSDMPGRLVFSTTADGASSSTERMRITSNTDGQLLLGTTSGSNSSSTGVKLKGGSASSVDVVINAASNINLNHVYNVNATNNGYRFYIQANGGIVNHSGNNTNLSDEREKKNIADMDSAWSDLKQWVLREFHFNDEDDSDPKHYGVIAQQVETVSPEVISDFQKDETTTRKGVKEMQMMWMAIKALQEAQARIETLETKVAALEAQ